MTYEQPGMSVSTPTRAQRAERHLMRVRGAGKIARDINRDIFSFSISSSSDDPAVGSVKRRKLHHDAASRSADSSRRTTTTSTSLCAMVAQKNNGMAIVGGSRSCEPGSARSAPPSTNLSTELPEPDTMRDNLNSADIKPGSVSRTAASEHRALAKAQARARATKLFEDVHTQGQSATTTSLRSRSVKQLPIFRDPSPIDAPKHDASGPVEDKRTVEPAQRGRELAAADRPAELTESTKLHPSQTNHKQQNISLGTTSLISPKKQLRRSARARTAAIALAIPSEHVIQSDQSTVVPKTTTAASLRRTVKTSSKQDQGSVQLAPAATKTSAARRALSSINPNKDLKRPIQADDKPKKMTARALLRRKIELVAGKAAADSFERSYNSYAGPQGNEENPSSTQSPVFDSASLKSFASRHHIKTVTVQATKDDKPAAEKLMLSSSNRTASLISRKRPRDDQHEDMDVDDLITNIATLTKGVEKRFSQDLGNTGNKPCTFR